MWPNPHFPADLVSFSEEILNENFHFFLNCHRCCDVTGHWQVRGQTYLVRHDFQQNTWKNHDLPAKHVKKSWLTSKTRAICFSFNGLSATSSESRNLKIKIIKTLGCHYFDLISIKFQNNWKYLKFFQYIFLWNLALLR